MKWLSSALRDPLLLGNLLLRLALVIWVAVHGYYKVGDSYYYLESAKRVCQGQWGGDAYRMPFYFWYLCGLSFGGVSLALIIQTLTLWGVGVFLTRRFGRVIGAIWLFDPILLVYSNLVMTDALFAAAMVALAICARKLLLQSRSSLGLAATTGFVIALAILIRPIGMPLFAATLCFLVFRAVQNRIAWSQIILLVTVTSLLLAPRLYWNGTRNQGWKLSVQDKDISEMFAGIATYTKDGLDFTQAQQRWVKEHPRSTVGEDYRALTQNLSTTSWLAAKSVLRVMFGHVSVEGFYILTGRYLIGPGWFKNVDAGQPDQKLKEPSHLLWISAVLASVLLCLAIYLWLIREIFRSRVRNAYVVWSILAMVVLVISPVFVGDARFRAPVMALALVLVGFCRLESKFPGRISQADLP